MGFPEPYDWNQNGKVDTEDWIIEEEQRHLSEERRKEQQAKKHDAFPEPPATESETRQGIRACITLGVSAAVFLFFMTELRLMDDSLPVQYSDWLWLNLIVRVTVFEDGRLVFRFKNGMEISETL